MYGKPYVENAVAQELELNAFFSQYDNRLRGQGVKNDGQKRWPERIRIPSREGDKVATFNKNHILNGFLYGNEEGISYPIVGLGLREPIGVMTELEKDTETTYSLILVLDGVRDNHGLMAWKQAPPRNEPTTKSPINLDSMYEHKWRMGAVVVKQGDDTPTVMSKKDFCNTTEGKQIFKGVVPTGDETPLDGVLRCLEIRLSRTDTGRLILENHKSNRYKIVLK